VSIKADKIWMDGELVNFEDAQVHVLTHTLHYGLGAFEGIRCYKRVDGRSAIFRLAEHVERLLESCHIATLTGLAWGQEEIERACIETVKANSFTDCYLRPMVFVGHGRMGLAAMDNPIRLSIAAWEWGSYLGDEGMGRGIRAKVSSFARHHVNAGMVKGKINGQYVNSILAKREAMADGYEEAIMLDTDGYVTEGTGENIFVVKRGVIYTTDFHGAILGGITRDTIMTLAREKGYEVREANMTRDFLYVADEIFVVGTAAEVTPIREVDQRKIGKGEPGPVTKALQAAYFDQVRGGADNHPEWLAYIQ
jgi:branched-chain amino acid aminotransferase